MSYKPREKKPEDIPEEEIRTAIKEKEQERLELIDWTDIPGLDTNMPSRYSPETKVQALTAFVVTGSLLKASKMTGVNYSTIRGWSNRTEWWKQGLDKIRKLKNDELDARISLAMDKAMDELDDRLEKGDVVLDRVTGEQRRKPLGGAELTKIMGILYDKRALSRGDPTSRTVQQNSGSVLKDLKAEFEKLSEEIQQKNKEKVINAVYEEVD